MTQSRLSLLSPIKSAGFTLLELVLVLFLIGLLASAGLLFTDNIENQAQFDETQRRLEVIRKAIIQAGDRTVNGQPELSGFVVDNGRLPYCLEELIYVDTSAVSGINYLSPCNSELTVPQPGVTDKGIRYGWWGPYIQVQPDRDGLRRFRDGYENQIDASDPNFSWMWTLQASDLTPIPNPPIPTDPMAYQLAISSLGFDINDAADDYPPAGSDEIIKAIDWLYDEDVTIRFVNTSAVSAIEENEADDWTLTLAKSGVSATKIYQSDFDLTPGESGILKDFDEYRKNIVLNEPVPAGYYLLEITCAESANCPEMVSEPYTITLLPRQQLAPLRWNLRPR